MDFVEMVTAVLAIIMIDLVLAGDNAIVIGLAARNLPKEQQKVVIFWGTIGAIVTRIVATLAVVWLLRIPWLLLVGGILLMWIAIKVLIDDKDHEIEAHSSVLSAIGTIIVADTVMGLDNVLAVAGIAHNNYWLVILGLLITVPIVVWGSTFFLRLIERFPWIMYIGSGILAWTAARMIVSEKMIQGFFEDNPLLRYGFEIVVVLVALLIGYWKNNNKRISDPTATKE